MEIPKYFNYLLNIHALLSALLGRKSPATHTDKLNIFESNQRSYRY